ncbi:hypothetical protein V6N13_059242 [Hibiscus sabdariffa]
MDGETQKSPNIIDGGPGRPSLLPWSRDGPVLGILAVISHDLKDHSILACKATWRAPPRTARTFCHSGLPFRKRGLKTKNSNDEDGNNQETAEADRFSSCNCSALFNLSSDSDIDEASMFTDNPKPPELHAEREEKAAVDTKFEPSTCMEHSPQSVLEAIFTSTGSPLDSTTLWSLLHQTRVREQSSCEGLEDLDASVSRRVLQQTKQLLLDCVRELVVDHNSGQGKGKGKGKGKEGFIGSEEIGNAICERIRGWGKPCGDDETSMQEMLEPKEERWNDFGIGSGKREMALLLGNAIVEEITSEVAMDMIII